MGGGFESLQLSLRLKLPIFVPLRRATHNILDFTKFENVLNDIRTKATLAGS